MVKGLAFILIIVSIWNCGDHKKSEPVPRHIEDPLKGEKLFRESGCTTCHSLTGEKTYGPELTRILGKDVEVIRNGKSITVKVDRAYLLRSLKNPEFEKVNGYQRKHMPVLNLTEDDIEYLVDFLTSVNKIHQADSLKK